MVVAKRRTSWVAFETFRTTPWPTRPDTDVRAPFARWIALPEPQRGSTPVPFDTIHAQALGLLPPATAQSIPRWGSLLSTVHTRRLKALGFALELTP